MYVGQDMLWTFYEQTGDAGPAVGLAHEFGHHIQQSMGVPAPRTAEQSTRHENQADCVAGAWTRTAAWMLAARGSRSLCAGHSIELGAT